MSELTPCNHCTLEAMKARAKKRGIKVKVEQVRLPDEMAGWYAATYSDESKPAVYFMSLTVGCAC